MKARLALQQQIANVQCAPVAQAGLKQFQTAQSTETLFVPYVLNAHHEVLQNDNVQMALTPSVELVQIAQGDTFLSDNATLHMMHSVNLARRLVVKVFLKAPLVHLPRIAFVLLAVIVQTVNMNSHLAVEVKTPIVNRVQHASLSSMQQHLALNSVTRSVLHVLDANLTNTRLLHVLQHQTLCV